MRSLIICHTPLQILIAIKIIEQYENMDFDVLVIALANNNKYQYYYKRIGENKKTKKIFLFNYKIGSNSLEILKNFYQFKKFFNINFSNNKYKSIIYSSINSRECQYITSIYNNSELITYDDGIANIVVDSDYYKDDTPKFFNKLVWFLLGVKFFSKDIRNKIDVHYTIYERLPNISKNVKYISLIKDDTISCTSNYRVVKIFLGQPLLNISNKFSSDFIEQLISKLNIDYYLPHPREDLIVNNVKKIETKKIFEEYIQEYLDENKDTKVIVYNFCSTAAFNVCENNRVIVKFVYDEIIEKDYPSIYELINKFNCDVVRL